MIKSLIRVLAKQMLSAKTAEFETENVIKADFERQLTTLRDEKTDRDKVIERLKNMGSQLSTKMVERPWNNIVRLNLINYAL